MNKIIVAICIFFVMGAVMCSDIFAQRYVNSAGDAARKAKESLVNKGNRSSSQIEWLDNVINTINMDKPVHGDVAAENNKAIEESRCR